MEVVLYLFRIFVVMSLVDTTYRKPDRHIMK